MPESLGSPVYVGCIVDADHGGNIITIHFHSVILSFVNNALIKSFSKHQNTVESRTFVWDIFVLKIARDRIV